VIDAITIADRDARHLEDTLSLLPNVSSSSGGGRARFVQVRGIGDIEQFTDPKHYPSIGVIIDDVDLGTGAGGATLLDIDQIELLRGPQGTRFGASAAAGMIRLTAREPDESLAGRVEAGYGNHDSWLLGGAIGGPLRPNLGGRLAVQQYRSDGFIRNAHLGRDDSNGRDELTLQGKLVWTNAGPLRIALAGYYFDLDHGYDSFSLDSRRITQTDQPGADSQQTAAGALHLDWDFANGMTAQLVASHASGDSLYAFDEDWVYTGFCADHGCDPALEYSSTDRIARDRAQWSVDTRVLGGTEAGISFVTGVYFQQRGEDLERTHYGSFHSQYDSQRFAAYGQLLWPLATRFDVIAGARIERFSDAYRDSAALVRDTHDSFWSGELTIKYYAGARTLWYTTVSRGVKPGGVNTEASSSLPLLDPALQPFVAPRLTFGAETLWNKELGIKGHYLKDRLALRLALFHLARGHAQLESWLWDAANALWAGFIDGGSGATNYGAETEFDFSISERAKVFGSVGLLHTAVRAITVFDLDSSAFVTKVDRAQAQAPRVQYHFGMELRPFADWRWRLEVEGRAKRYFGYYHDGRLPAAALVHSNLSHDWNRLRVRLWARNLLNQDHAVHGLYFGADPRDGYLNHTYLQSGESRAVGINLSYEVR
jgi:hypothetical protein